ncbi:MAG: WD40 repeat domain-containing protein [Gemmataceae bacterium]
MRQRPVTLLTAALLAGLAVIAGIAWVRPHVFPAPLAPRLTLSIDRTRNPAHVARNRRLISTSPLSLAVSPDGRTVAVGLGDGSVRVWDAVTGRFIRALTGFGDHVTALAFRPDGRVLACGSSNGEPIRLLDPISGELHGVVTGSAYDRFTASQSLAYSPDGHKLVGSFYHQDFDHPVRGGEVAVFDPTDGSKVRVLASTSSGFARFTPDGAAVVFRQGSQVVVAAADTGRPETTFKVPPGHMLSDPVAVSPDGASVAAMVDNGGSFATERWVTVWDRATGQERAAMTGHEQPLVALEYLPDGQTLVSASWDGTIRFWDVRRQAERLRITSRPGHNSLAHPPRKGFVPVMAAALSADGSVLAAADYDGTVRVWDVPALLAVTQP